MGVIAELTIAALRANAVGSMEGYAFALAEACDAAPPPFGMHWYGEKFRTLALDASWLAASLIQNAQVEGDGARKLWALAGRAPDSRIARLVRQHAIDESRHALLYLAMLNLTFPGAVDAELKPLLAGISPRYGPNDDPPTLPLERPEHVLDELIQMNIGEIRTRIHQLLLRPMLRAHTTEAKRSQLQGVLDALLADETKHIAYTARLIEEAMEGGQRDYVRQTFRRRVRDFNEITLHEVGAEQFTGE
jgi:hypothetical protein